MMIKKIDLETLLLEEFQDVDKTSCDEDEERDKKGERHSGWILQLGSCSGELSSQTIEAIGDSNPLQKGDESMVRDRCTFVLKNAY